MSADAAVLAAVNALAQSPLRPGVLDDVQDVASVAALRKQVRMPAKTFPGATPRAARSPRLAPAPRRASLLAPFHACWTRARHVRHPPPTPVLPRDR